MALAHFQETVGRVLADGDVFIGSGAQVEVRDETNGALASIFTDRDGVTPKSNPFNADSQGFADFYVATGRYRVKVSISGNVTLDLRDFEVLSNDISGREVTTSTGTQTLAGALDQRGPVFDTVADLVASPDVTVGIKCRTLGYNAIGDGGGNDYEIVAAGTGTDDGGSFINLSGSGLQAKGLFNSSASGVDVRQFGAMPNDDQDWSPNIQAAVDFLGAAAGKIILKGKFRTSNPITIGNRITIEGDGKNSSGLRVDSDVSGVIIEKTNGIAVGRAGVKSMQVWHYNNGSKTYTNGSAILIRGDVDDRVWQTRIEDFQAYQSPWGIRMSDRAVETYIRSVEISDGNIGIEESSDSFDTIGEQVYIDSMSQNGLRLFGGSGTFIHAHCVNCGEDDGAGNVTGSGIFCDTNYYDFYGCHADRNVGHGIVVGSSGPDPARAAIRLHSCMSFNNGNGDSQGVTETSDNLRIGRVTLLEVIGGYYGRIGNDLASNNIRGIHFTSSVADGTFTGVKVRDNTEYGVMADSDLSINDISFIGCDFIGNGSSFNSNALKVMRVACKGASDLITYGETREKTISSGTVSVDCSHILLTAEGDSLDDLTTINGGQDGMVLVIRRNPSATGTIRVQTTGNIRLKDSEPGETYWNLNTTNRILTLMYVVGSGNWVQT